MNLLLKYWHHYSNKGMIDCRKYDELIEVREKYMNFRKRILVSILLIIGLLAGCSSIEDVSEETTTHVEQAFKEKSPEPNKEYGTISYFLPEDLKVDEQGENNFILKKGEQLFILFVNPNENLQSEVLYQSINPDKGSFAIDKTFKDKDRFGYVKAYEIDDKNYLLSVGIGGVKMTTETKLGDINENATEMMKVVSSLKY